MNISCRTCAPLLISGAILLAPAQCLADQFTSGMLAIEPLQVQTSYGNHRDLLLKGDISMHLTPWLSAEGGVGVSVVTVGLAAAWGVAYAEGLNPTADNPTLAGQVLSLHGGLELRLPLSSPSSIGLLAGTRNLQIPEKQVCSPARAATDTLAATPSTCNDQFSTLYGNYLAATLYLGSYGGDDSVFLRASRLIAHQNQSAYGLEIGMSY